MNWRHINKEKLKALNPCKDRWESYLKHYSDFKGDIVEFLELEHITPEDKVWVFVRIAPKLLLEVFALDCAFSAVRYYAYAAAAYAAAAVRYSAATAPYADYAAYVAYATKEQERENQVDAMIIICEGEK